MSRNPNACEFGGPHQACVPWNCKCGQSGPSSEYLATWPDANRIAYHRRRLDREDRERAEARRDPRQTSFIP